MRYYPLFLDLADTSVLVVGAGEVGLRKAAVLLRATPARLDLLDPFMDEVKTLSRLGTHPLLRLHRRAFTPADIAGRSLVFAATDKREVNALVSSLCREKNILCNVADAPGEGNFIVPSLINADGLTIAVSTGGQSPALAKKLRRELEAWVEKRYSPLLFLLGRLRPLLLALDLPTNENSSIFRRLVNSPLADLLQDNDYGSARDLLAGILPEPLRHRMGELLDGL